MYHCRLCASEMFVTVSELKGTCDTFHPTAADTLKRHSVSTNFCHYSLSTVSLHCQVVCLPLRAHAATTITLTPHLADTCVTPPTHSPLNHLSPQPLCNNGTVFTLKTVGAEGRCRVAACCMKWTSNNLDCVCVCVFVCCVVGRLIDYMPESSWPVTVKSCCCCISHPACLVYERELFKAHTVTDICVDMFGSENTSSLILCFYSTCYLSAIFASVVRSTYIFYLSKSTSHM